MEQRILVCFKVTRIKYMRLVYSYMQIQIKDFVGKSASSIMIFHPGLKKDCKLSKNLFHTFETKANLSDRKRIDLVLWMKK